MNLAVMLAFARASEVSNPVLAELFDMVPTAWPNTSKATSTGHTLSEFPRASREQRVYRQRMHSSGPCAGHNVAAR